MENIVCSYMYRIAAVVTGLLVGLRGTRLYMRHPFLTVGCAGALIALAAFPPSYSETIAQVFHSQVLAYVFILLVGAVTAFVLVKLTAAVVGAIVFAAGGFSYLFLVVIVNDGAIASLDVLLKSSFTLVQSNPYHLIPFFIAGLIAASAFKFLKTLFTVMLSSVFGALFSVSVGFGVLQPVFVLMSAALFAAVQAYQLVDILGKRRPATREEILKAMASEMEKQLKEEKAAKAATREPSDRES